MEFLERYELSVQVTGTVVELADGRLFRLSRDETSSVGPDGVLTVVTYEDDRIGQRRHVRRYSPAAWISVDETSDQAPPGQLSRLADPGPGIRG